MTSDDLKRVRSKIAFLKQRYDSLDAFVRLEVSMELEESRAQAEDLENAIRTLTTELASMKERRAVKNRVVARDGMISLFKELDFAFARYRQSQEEVDNLTSQRDALAAQIESARRTLSLSQEKVQVVENLKNSLGGTHTNFSL